MGLSTMDHFHENEMISSSELSLFSDFEVAAVNGTVAASFAIEQIGLPKVTYRNSDSAESWNGDSPFDRAELWNGEVPYDRLRTMVDRILKLAATQTIGIEFKLEHIGPLLEFCRAETLVSAKTVCNTMQPCENEAKRSNDMVARPLQQTPANEENVKLPVPFPCSYRRWL